MPAPLFQDPQAATAIELLQQPGQYRARALSEIAAVQANAQVQGAQAWAGAANNIGQTIAQIPQQVQQQKTVQQQQTIAQQTIAANARAAQNAQLVDDTKRRINALATDPTVFNPDGTLNTKTLQERLGKPTPGVNGPNQAPDLSTLFSIVDPINEGLAKGRQTRLAFEQQKDNVIARGAAGVLKIGDKTGDYFGPAMTFLAGLEKSTWITPQEKDQYVAQMVEHKEALPQLLSALVQKNTVAPIVLPDKARLISGVDQETPLVGAQAERPKTKDEILFDAHDPNSPTRAISQAALEADAEKVPLDQVLYKAISAKDAATPEGKARIANVVRAIHDDAVAKHIEDPNKAAMDALRMSLERQQLDAAKERAAPIDITPEVQTSMVGGKMYLDSERYASVNDKSKARVAAEKLGVPFLSKDEAAGLVAADRAALNLNGQWRSVSTLLPKDASGRLLGGAENTLEKIFQTNPDLGAFGSWRAAAIQTIQALAEQRAGLRLNQNEINLMLDSVPKLTDDVATAEKKVLIIGSMIKNKVDTLLVRDRSTLSQQGDIIAPPPAADTPPPPAAPRAPIKRTEVTPAAAAAPPPPPPPPPPAGGRAPIIRRPVGQ